MHNDKRYVFRYQTKRTIVKTHDLCHRRSAKYFAAVRTKEEVLEAIAFAEKKKLPFFCWAGGAMFCSMTTAMTA